MSCKPEPANIHFLTTRPLVEALWWFIENVNEENQFRSEYFFTLRERYREECQLVRAQIAARNLADAGGTAPAMEDVPRRGRTEECPPIVVDPEGDEASDMVMDGEATAWIRIGDRLIIHLSTHGGELEVEVLPKADVTGVPYNRFKIEQ